jgi:hypothetical protein
MNTYFHLMYNHRKRLLAQRIDRSNSLDAHLSEEGYR